MSVEQNKTAGNSENQQIRLSVVDTAVNFLLNPAVIDKPYAHKTAFLKNKGLSDAEISLAYKKVENDPKFKEPQGNEFSKRPSVPALLPPVPAYRSLSFWSQLSRISSSLIVLGVALFGAHYVYKKYIEPLIFGSTYESDKFSHLEKQILEITNALSQIEKNVSALEESIKCQKVEMDTFLKYQENESHPSVKALVDLKSEIATIKSMLLNRNQFPALPKISSIPKWQLPAKEDTIDIKSDKVDEHKDQNITKDSSETQIQLQQNGGNVVKENGVDAVKQNGEDAAKQNGPTVDLKCSSNIQSVQNQSSEELNESPVFETISSISESSEKLNNFPIQEPVTSV